MTFEKLITFALERRASDLILKSDSGPVLRVHGELERLEAPILRDHDIMQFLSRILTEAQLREYREKLDFDAAVALGKLGRARLNVFQQRRKISVVMRLIPPAIPSLAELHLPPVVRDLALRERGLLLVTGPAGCGKTTTIAAMAAYRAACDYCHIITIEDPVEYTIPGAQALVNQRELGRDTHSFSTSLRHALRQDPDVIIVGEMRDLETIQMAITAAETGHLVLSTLHTMDAVRTLDRVIEAFPGYQQRQVRLQLSANLVGVVSQLLLKRADGKGLALACEILTATVAVQNLIRESKHYMIASILQTKSDDTMRPMNRSLMELIQKRVVTPEEALGKSPLPDELEKLLGRA